MVRVLYSWLSGCGSNLIPGHLQVALSKLLIYCVIRSPQPPTLSGRVMNSGLRLWSEGLVWLIGVVVWLLAAPWVQLFAGAGNGWLHNVLRCHWFMPIRCHLLCLVMNLTHISSVTLSTGPLPLKQWSCELSDLGSFTCTYLSDQSFSVALALEQSRWIPCLMYNVGKLTVGSAWAVSVWAVSASTCHL